MVKNIGQWKFNPILKRQATTLNLFLFQTTWIFQQICTWLQSGEKSCTNVHTHTNVHVQVHIHISPPYAIWGGKNQNDGVLDGNNEIRS